MFVNDASPKIEKKMTIKEEEKKQVKHY